VYHGGVPTLKLTARALDNLPLPSRGRVEYFDESLLGFAVRIFPRGRRVFTLLYRMKGGRTKKKERVDIGTYPPLTLAQAREPSSKPRSSSARTRVGTACPPDPLTPA
jgi:hypothetical protein